MFRPKSEPGPKNPFRPEKPASNLWDSCFFVKPDLTRPEFWSHLSQSTAPFHANSTSRVSPWKTSIHFSISGFRSFSLFTLRHSVFTLTQNRLHFSFSSSQFLRSLFASNSIEIAKQTMSSQPDNVNPFAVNFSLISLVYSFLKFCLNIA